MARAARIPIHGRFWDRQKIRIRAVPGQGTTPLLRIMAAKLPMDRLAG
jgi:hypothetical protein